EVGLVHDLGQPPQHRVGQIASAQNGLEAAVGTVVPEFGAAHVERGRVGRHLGRVGDEQEAGVGIEEPADQPGAGGPVDVHALAGGPVHGCASSFVAASCRTRTAACAVSRSGGGK